MPFDATGRMAAAIPFTFDDYLELVGATGRVIPKEKRGYITGETPQILERLNIDPEQFIATTTRMLQPFRVSIGRSLIVAQPGLGEGPAVARSRPAAMLPDVTLVC